MKKEDEESRLREAASRMARQLAHCIAGVLYEWEVKDAENEFFETILAGLKELNNGSRHHHKA
jgi:hypothetical protein